MGQVLHKIPPGGAVTDPTVFVVDTEPEYKTSKSATKSAKTTGISYASLAVVIVGALLGSPEFREAVEGIASSNKLVAGAIVVGWPVLTWVLNVFRDRTNHRGPNGELIQQPPPLRKVETR